ncbi:uncharacterized protein LOC110349169 [Heterocephalus glaber]|uniref:Uncharacterized protein LOC110349169 n=1 Tax=Heterocephalus glaber TaxID=10181 RepID=A0AAX6SXY0_HETGA|nr:uncharacterized protein LOC110349169 [Heterocephalus glaber]
MKMTSDLVQPHIRPRRKDLEKILTPLLILPPLIPLLQLHRLTLSPPHTQSGQTYKSQGTTSQVMFTVLPLKQIEPGGGFVCIPFTTSYLYNWKNQVPPFSEKTQALIHLLESVFHTHQPTWDNCQQLLHTLFTTEEWTGFFKRLLRRLWDKPRPWSQRAEAEVPTHRLDWDPNTDAGRRDLASYHQHLLQGLCQVARKLTNLTKMSEVKQNKTESPEAFLELLLEAYRVYTPINPDAPENAATINRAFVSQSAPDIRKKLQRLEGFEGKNRSELLSIAQKVFNNRDSPEEVVTKRLGKVTIAALKNYETSKQTGRPKPERPPWPKLGRDQCAYCKQTGHWKNECPLKKEKEGQNQKKTQEVLTFEDME